eukprot:12347406-Karenia_brevis.AAC.1
MHKPYCRTAIGDEDEGCAFSVKLHIVEKLACVLRSSSFQLTSLTDFHKTVMLSSREPIALFKAASVLEDT